ncbi:hypothetical protein [Chelatococcus sp.]|uniref:phage late control D family protein n=1 Tax=Chelatococcus sp. TaxID=1953771 RepID=UPI001EB5B612|nr:hypothetical protein [Chelatococcus sp.]MBX3545609.1 hypothetical protein [Chelatococcus sp.]
MWRRPLLRIMSQGGNDVLGNLRGRWREVRITDNRGEESDTADIVSVWRPNMPLPRKGDSFTIYLGWQDSGEVIAGTYTAQKPNVAGGPDDGETVTVRLRAADYIDKLKAMGREHYDRDTTFGDLMDRVAREAGISAEVDSELRSRKLPHVIRWDQSLIDFATEQGDILGATVKPMAGKLLAMKRGAARSAGGQVLEPIVIGRRGCISYEIEVEPRPIFGNVAAYWHDQRTGRRKAVKHATGRKGPTSTLPHPYQSEEEAKAAAESRGYNLGNSSCTGRFEYPGLPSARAEAPVIISGFGRDIDGTYTAETVEHSVTADGIFTTTISIGAGDKGGTEDET